MINRFDTQDKSGCGSEKQQCATAGPDTMRRESIVVQAVPEVARRKMLRPR